MSEKTAAIIESQQPLKQLIIFKVSDEEFGVSIEDVQEIIKVTLVTPIPDTPKFIKGLINVRGDIVPTIDLRARFDLPDSADDAKHVVITKQEGNVFGLIVDEVTEILRVQENSIKPPPHVVTHIQQAYISGVITYEKRLIILLNVSNILSQQELNRLFEQDKLKIGKKLKPHAKKNGVMKNNQT